ncbi:hypothetical protein G9A89_010272 [Geosiphon pyriformis]|nr:hypothetical protein G9A89_010272 [Geosiphon pyriformis]
MNHVLLVTNNYLTKECGMIFLVKEEHVILHVSIQSSSAIGYLYNKDEIWWMANAKVKGAMPSEILEIKNNPSKQVDIILVPNPDAFLDIETNLEDFHEHYQNLAPIREEQEQHLAQINTKLYSNSNLNYEQYIALSDLTKEQELKWFSDNNEDIMPECAHDTNARFDLRYPEKNTIKLKPHLHTSVDFKIALEILTTTMVQLAFRSSLAKKGINIRRGIIDVRYIENIITMLQNNSEKTYIIKSNEKIAQTIFLPLVKIAQLVSVEKREELGITARGIQGFGSMGRINVPINMAEKEIVGQGEIISTSQAIFIPLYDQYMVTIERKVKNQNQIFEAKTSLCESGEIGLINLHIPAKSHNHIKIPIYNTTEDAITIPEGIIIGYLSTGLENQPPSIIPDFSQLCRYVDITSQTICG